MRINRFDSIFPVSFETLSTGSREKEKKNRERMEEWKKDKEEGKEFIACNKRMNMDRPAVPTPKFREQIIYATIYTS